MAAGPPGGGPRPCYPPARPDDGEERDMPEYRLADEFVDHETERGVVAAAARDAAVYWRLADIVAPDAFAAERAAWDEVATATEEDRPVRMPPDWQPAADPV